MIKSYTEVKLEDKVFDSLICPLIRYEDVWLQSIVAYEWVPAGALVYLDWCMTSLLVYLEAK
jgi:hypothetical protein